MTKGEPETTRSWVLRGTHRIQGETRVPGDKSISHRSLLLAAMAQGMTEVRGFLRSEDCLATLRALSFAERIASQRLTTLELSLMWAALGALLFVLERRRAQPVS